MEINTLQSFDRWNEVEYYESDETTVTLFNAKKEAIAEFNYPWFTAADFVSFKSANYESEIERLNSGDNSVTCFSCGGEMTLAPSEIIYECECGYWCYSSM